LVASYFPPELGPAPARMGALSRGLVQLGADVEVLTCNPRYPHGHKFSPSFGKEEAISTEGVALRYFPVPVSNGKVLPRMIEQMRFYTRGLARGRKLPPLDIVIGSSPFFTAACLAWRLSRHWGCPFIYDVRDLYPESLRLARIAVPALLYRYLCGWAHRLYEGSSFVVVNQPSLHASLSKRLPPRKLRMAMNPVELSEGDAYRDSRLSESLTVGYAGLWGRGYDFPALLSVIEQADASEFNFRLIGSGYWENGVREFAQQDRTNLSVHYGWMRHEQLLAEYASWDIALLPVKPNWCASMWPAKIPELVAHGIVTIVPSELPLPPSLVDSPFILRAPEATAQGYLQALNEASRHARTLTQQDYYEAREMIRREFAPSRLAQAYAEVIRQALPTKAKYRPEPATPD